MGREAKTFAIQFHEAQRQRTYWIQTRLQEPHVRRPSLVVLNSGVGRPECPTDRHRMSRSEWVYGWFNEGGKYQGYGGSQNG